MPITDDRLKNLWKLHQDVESIVRQTGMKERTLVKRLRSLKIEVPNATERKRIKLQRWIETVTPKLIPGSVWMRREIDRSLKTEYDAYYYSRRERFNVYTTRTNGEHWNFNIGDAKKTADALLLVCLDIHFVPVAAYYVPTEKIKQGRKFLKIQNNSQEWELHRISIESI